MNVEEIRAHSAVNNGDFVVIKKFSYRFVWAISGAILGLLLDLWFIAALFNGYFVATFVVCALCCLIDEGHFELQVPVSDVVSIKQKDKMVIVKVDQDRLKRTGFYNDIGSSSSS